jgi:hypothetical protein
VFAGLRGFGSLNTAYVSIVSRVTARLTKV